MGLGLRQYWEVLKWWRSGKPFPVPHRVKRKTLLKLSRDYQCSVLIETGTYYGHMVEGTRRAFRKIISIEIDDKLYQRALDRFKDDKNVLILQGDSGKVLPDCLRRDDLKDENILFWLDGHYSAGVTGRGDLDTPIAQELEAVLKRDHRGDVILIDDAHYFVGKDGYPELQKLLSEVSATRPDLRVHLDLDMIQFFPEKVSF